MRPAAPPPTSAQAPAPAPDSAWPDSPGPATAEPDAPPRLLLLPSRRAALAWLGLAGVVLGLAALGGPVALQAGVAGVLGTALAGAWALDAWHSRALLRRHPLQLTRQLPAVLPLGVAREVLLLLTHEGPHPWQAEVFDGIAPDWLAPSLPLHLPLPGQRLSQARYSVTALRRGPATLSPARVRLGSRWGGWQIQVELGPAAQAVRVFPNFAEVARYAWLADDRRLAQLGIRTGVARGQGTDFRQLADYVPGDPVRHIDWKATQRRGHPVVRQFQDERDQRVWLLLDCGRRLRADDTPGRPGVALFDQALNALILLAHVALKAGDEVGVITFGHEPGEAPRQLAPRKGAPALDVLMTALHDLHPGTAHPDYREVAHRLMQQSGRRALVVVLTTLREEDAPELHAAQRLLRSRHLVSVATLRDPTLDTLAAQPLDAHPQAAAEVATAHLFARERARTLAGLQGPGTWLLDVLPADLPAALVSHYLMLKRSHRL